MSGLTVSLFADGCQHYDQDTAIPLKWTQAGFGTHSVPNGRHGRGIQLGSVQKTMTAYQSSWIQGVAMYFSGNYVGNTSIFMNASTCGTQICGAYLEPDWTLSLFSGGTRVANSGASGFSIHPYTWYYFELKCVFSTATGIYASMTLRCNGVVICSGAGDSGVNPATQVAPGSWANNLGFIGPNLPLGYTIACDFYIYPPGAGGHYTDFLGDVALGALFPMSDAETQWTANPGPSSYAMVNSQFPENAAGDIQSNTAGQNTTFGWQPFGGEQIIFVHYGAWAKKDNEGTRSFQLTDSGNPTLAPTVYPGDSYAYYFFGMDVDPSTGDAWTIAGFNASTFGIECIS